MAEMKARILVVEDEADIRDLLLLHLKREGYETDWAGNGEDALRLLKAGRYQLVVLDWMLPELSGLEVCRRMEHSAPVLMVTARADAADIVLGLEAGADDYVTKPFEIPVFLARVRALLRRANQQANSKNTSKISAGALSVDLERYEVHCGGTPVQLTPSEFKLLTALIQSRGKVLSREKLIELVQGEGVVVVDRAIDTHVFGLRRKLGACSEIIETIRGVGYRVVAE
ncbi:MAG: response regulator transcription factor [Bdellovibrionota bacterium]